MLNHEESPRKVFCRRIPSKAASRMLQQPKTKVGEHTCPGCAASSPGTKRLRLDEVTIIIAKPRAMLSTSGVSGGPH